MRPAPPLSEQIAYAEGELERLLRFAPGLIRTGVREAADVQREIELQTAIVGSLKRQKRALEAVPADLGAACDAIQAEVARMRTTIQGGSLRQVSAA